MLSEQDFFSPLKGRHFSGEKAAASLQVFYSKEKKPSVTQSYCVEEAGKATFYSSQKEAKLPFLFVNRPYSGTLNFEIPELHFIALLLMKNGLNITFSLK